MHSEGWIELGSVTTGDVVEQPGPFKGGASWTQERMKRRKEDRMERR